MGWGKAKIGLAALGLVFLNACDQEKVSPKPQNVALPPQTKIDLDKAEAYTRAGERYAEEYALSRGYAIPVIEADQIAGRLHVDYHLIDIQQMLNLAEAIRVKSSFGSPDIMSRPDYERIKQDPAYDDLSQKAKDKLNELVLPKLGF